jgi:hypothetical protein
MSQAQDNGECGVGSAYRPDFCGRRSPFQVKIHLFAQFGTTGLGAFW